MAKTLLCILLAVSTTMACGPSTVLDGAGLGVFGPSTSGSSSSVAVASCSAWQPYAHAECEHMARCSSFGITSITNVQQCEHNLTSLTGILYFNSPQDSRLQACVNELAAPGCGDLPTCATIGRKAQRAKGLACTGADDCQVGLACIEDACADRRADGGSCNHSEDCASGLSCQDGTCHAVTDGATACNRDDECIVARDVESPFGGAEDNFVGAFFCDQNTLRCAAVAHDLAAGASCGPGKACADDLFCKGVNGTGTCARPPAYGEACSSGDGCVKCEGGTCKDPLKDGLCK